MQHMNCKLCNATALLFSAIKNREYYKCSECSSVMLHPKYFLPPQQEKARYETHNNCVNDK